MRSIVDLVAPLRCVACAAPCDGELCPSCAEDVSVLAPPWCERCGSPSTSMRCPCSGLLGFGRARSVVAFVEPARRLTLALKRRGRRGLADAVGSIVAALVERESMFDRTTTVTWVTGGATAVLAGFDHNEVLARSVARVLGVGARRLLRRERDGRRQSEVSLNQRRENVRGRFGSVAATGHVLLVDDVFTTGATAEACAVALLGAGASSVDIVTWARTLRRAPFGASSAGSILGS